MGDSWLLGDGPDEEPSIDAVEHGVAEPLETTVSCEETGTESYSSSLSERETLSRSSIAGTSSSMFGYSGFMQDNGGVVPAVTEMYNRPTSMRTRKNGSLQNPKLSMYVYQDKMVQIEIERNAQEGAIPITQEVLSVKGLNAMSGYVKGLGIRPSSSIRTVNGEYVTHLEGKVQEQAEKIQEQAE
ncbi:hypothetical protein RHSIM_Rhsim01G0022000 [Rhododendron simsii]|uniref:Uncharacterized protein n=1 Tax=Rhododendron simsii TaxID=118357 RepID=A0A834HHG1_RHOSS|nr:hypothetical protein RHSIM_Rhsim01G0022000 [Rhododendron simsii]